MSPSNELHIYKKNILNQLNSNLNNKLKEYNSTLVIALNKLQNTKRSTNKTQQISLLINEYNKGINNLKQKFNNSTSSVNKFSPLLPPPPLIKKALLIGINYTNDKDNELYGCINDVKNIKNRLLKNGFLSKDIIELTDFTNIKPTKSNIVNELKKMINNAEKGDVLVFSFSGHGFNIKDYNKDEIDGYDECIYTIDDHYITDDTLKQIILPLKKGVTLFSVIDSCHSGTVLDLKYSYMDSTNYNNYTTNSKNLETQGTVFMISGCSDSQKSADAVIDDNPCGAMTTSLLKSLEKNPVCSWRELITNMRDYLKNNGFYQIPQISCGKFEDIDQKVFL